MKKNTKELEKELINKKVKIKTLYNGDHDSIEGVVTEISSSYEKEYLPYDILLKSKDGFKTVEILKMETIEFS